MANDNKKTKNNAPCEERQETRQLTEEELEKVTGGKTGAIPLRDDSVAAKLADAPTNHEVIKRIEVVVGSAELVAVKLAIDDIGKR